MSKENYKKFLRIILRFCLVLIILLIIGMGTIYALLLKNPNEMAALHLEALSKQTGLTFKIGAVDAVLMPLPSVVISDVEIRGSTIELYVPWVSLRPNFKLLFMGDFTPASITLMRPELNFNTELQLNPKNLIAPKQNPVNSSVSLPDQDIKPAFEKNVSLTLEQEILSGLSQLENLNEKIAATLKEYMKDDCELEINQANINLIGQNNIRLSLVNLNCALEVLESLTIKGELQFAALRVIQEENISFTLTNFYLFENLHVPDFLNSGNMLQIQGELYIKNLINKSNFYLNYDSSQTSKMLSLNVKANINLDGTDIPAALTGKIINLADTANILIKPLDWQLGADRGSLDATFILPDYLFNSNKNQYLTSTEPREKTDLTEYCKLKGTFYANRLSLTEWFGFARNLTPGLQLSLDNIFNVSLKFEASSKGLEAPFIEATCNGSRFTGSGSVASFAKPVVFLDLKSLQANLGMAMGEAVVESPIPPYYGHSTLTPMPGGPVIPGEVSIDYDIRLATQKLFYGPLTIDNASLRIYPGSIDKDGLQDVLLDANADFYEGKFKGQCILGGSDDLPLTITANTSNINGSLVAKAMPVLPFSKGQLKTSCSVKSRGKQLKQFLANLRGSINLEGQNVVLSALPKENFNKVNLTTSLKKAASGNSNVTFDANWKVNFTSKEFDGNLDLTGPILFDESGFAFKNLPLKASLNLLQPLAGLPANGAFSATGALTAQKEKFSLTGGNFSILSIPVSGNIYMDKKDSYSGSLQIPETKIEYILNTFGFAGNDYKNIPPNLSSITLKTEFNYNGDTLSLNKSNGKLGDSSFSGSASWHGKQLRFSLLVDSFNLEKALGEKGKSKQERPVNLSGFSAVQANGEFQIKNLSGWKCGMTNVKIPLSLNNGILTIPAASANFYGSPLTAKISANLNTHKNKGLSFNTVIKTNAFNLGSALKNRKLDGQLTGLASLDLDIKAKIQTWNEISKKLNGTWRFLLNKGSWQSYGKNGQLKGKPTIFSKIISSGSITNGLMKSNELLITGPGLNVSGNGTANLATKNLDCKLDISMKGWPDFPLTIYGTFDNPKTSIGAGKFVLNAIGEIFFGIFRGILSIFK